MERRKARVVAKGFAQRPGIDFNDTFAPVARLNSFRLLMALSEEFDMDIHQVDVTTAYLNGNIDEAVYMDKPDLLEQMLDKIAKEETNIKLVTKEKIMLDEI